jgi:hypothetical protein
MKRRHRKNCFSVLFVKFIMKMIVGKGYRNFVDFRFALIQLEHK